MVRSLALESLYPSGFRNLQAECLTFVPRFNIICGDNGQGKTNLLEGIYAVLTSKSFRTSRTSELLGTGSDVAFLRAKLCEEAERREQSLLLKKGTRTVKVDGKRPATLASYATASPVVVFHPGTLALSSGPSAERRRLLDRIALFDSPTILGELEQFDRALKARMRILETRGVEARDLEHWESLISQHGLMVSNLRSQAQDRLNQVVQEAFRAIASPGLRFSTQYRRASPLDQASYTERLRSQRGTDLRRRATSSGPHRDDLVLTLNDREAKGHASQGQHRAIVLALKLAEIHLIRVSRNVQPILLLDDVSSELDADRTAALFAHLMDHQGQVFLTTTRPDLIEKAFHRSDIPWCRQRMRAGALEPEQSSSS